MSDPRPGAADDDPRPGDEGDDAGESGLPLPPELRERLRDLADLFREFYVAPYRSTLARAARDEDDLFMLLVFSEMMGVPNPGTYYMLELLPLLHDRFHDWHRRMGMERSPLTHISCC